jgi:hypothetical protein
MNMSDATSARQDVNGGAIVLPKDALWTACAPFPMSVRSGNGQ